MKKTVSQKKPLKKELSYSEQCVANALEIARKEDARRKALFASRNPLYAAYLEKQKQQQRN